MGDFINPEDRRLRIRLSKTPPSLLSFTTLSVHWSPTPRSGPRATQALGVPLRKSLGHSYLAMSDHVRERRTIAVLAQVLLQASAIPSHQEPRAAKRLLRSGDRPRYLVILGAVAAIACAGLLLARSHPSGIVPMSPSHWIGRSIPQALILEANGETVSARRSLTEGPLILFLVGREDCLSCTQYAVEAKIIEQETGLRSVFVGSGPDTLFFDRFFRRHRLDFRIDPSASLISAFNDAGSPSLR